MSPRTVRGTGTRHTVEAIERGRERGWEPEEGDSHMKGAAMLVVLLSGVKGLSNAERFLFLF